jgi:hypothetical protein
VILRALAGWQEHVPFAQRPHGVPVALGCVGIHLEGEVQQAAWRVQSVEGSGVNLVQRGIAERMDLKVDRRAVEWQVGWLGHDKQVPRQTSLLIFYAS